MTPFDSLDALIKHKDYEFLRREDFEKEFSPWMLARLLSMRKDLSSYADIINVYSKYLTKENVARMVLKGVPKKSQVFISYIKKDTPKKKPGTEEEE